MRKLRGRLDDPSIGALLGTLSCSRPACAGMNGVDLRKWAAPVLAAASFGLR